MKVREIMTRDVEACAAGTDLAVAAGIMWRNDCGIVPVVEGPNRKVIGLIPDRDICMACSMRKLRPSGETSYWVTTPTSRSSPGILKRGAAGAPSNAAPGRTATDMSVESGER